MKNHEYKENSSQYDEQVKEYDSYAHDVIFGMSYEYLKPNEKLLDLGIGTGLASINFSKVGLKIYGLDISEDMLNVCRTKSFAVELKLHNLLKNKIPYSNNYFNHVICSGVFHFMVDLENIFSEVARLIIDGGIFAFTFSPNKTEEKYIKQMTSWKVPIFKHSPKYIKQLLDSNNMKILKKQRILMKDADKVNCNMLFSVMIAKYK